MIGSRILNAIGLAVLLLCGIARGAADPMADAALKAKGLTKVGISYLLDGDMNLRAGLRTVRQAASAVDTALAKRSELQRHLDAARQALSELYARDQEIQAQMARVQNVPFRYNELVGQVNQLAAQLHEASAYEADQEEALKRVSIPYDQYSSAVVAFDDQMEATQRQYDALAADSDVKVALSRLNAEARVPYKLGPSESFTTELRNIRRLRQKIGSTALKFDIEGGVPVVNVVLNGTLRWKMVLDSGAAIVTLTHDVAEQLGMTFEDSDQHLRMEAADGKVTIATLKVLKSVTLGPFTEENIPCVVMPKNVPGSNLLGGTFLQRFVYQMDLGAGEIHMTQISQSTKLDSSGDDSKSGPDAPAVPKPGGAPSPAVPSDKAIRIDAKDGWVSTSLRVEQGHCYRVTAAAGWTDSQGHDCGPDGGCSETCRALLGPPTELTDSQRAEFYHGQDPRGALICRIGDETWDFYVGSDRRFLAPVSGRLSFRMCDDDQPKSAVKSGACIVSISQIEPTWVRPNGNIEIIARVDSKDLLHLTPQGLFWEQKGKGGKLGLTDGYYPTVINGIFWWPNWAGDKTTEKLPVPALWPAQPEHVRVVEVDARRGDVNILRDQSTEVVFEFEKQDGPGSSQIGCVISTK